LTSFLLVLLAADAPVIVRGGTVAPPGTPWEHQIKRTSSHIEADAAGRVKFKVYLGGKKGDEKSLVRQCRDGRLEFVGVSTAALATKVPALQVLELPFLFESSEEADFVLDQYLYEPVKKLLAGYGFVLYQWAENGWQNVGTRYGFVKGPADLAGRKMRSQEAPVHLLTWTGFGAAPVEMAVSEVLPALKTGLVDGFAQTPLFTFAAGWQQGISHYTITRHVYQPAILAYSKKFYDGLDKATQEILLARVAEDTAAGRDDVRKIEPGLLQNFEAYGISLYTLDAAERAAFAKAAAAIQERYLQAAPAEAKALLKAIEAGKQAFRNRRG
jgi:TRAP-type C4-dicarboxylate transport system substrate-binding protein